MASEIDLLKAAIAKLNHQVTKLENDNSLLISAIYGSTKRNFLSLEFVGHNINNEGTVNTIQSIRSGFEQIGKLFHIMQYSSAGPMISLDDENNIAVRKSINFTYLLRLRLDYLLFMVLLVLYCYHDTSTTKYDFGTIYTMLWNDVETLNTKIANFEFKHFNNDSITILYDNGLIKQEVIDEFSRIEYTKKYTIQEIYYLMELIYRDSLTAVLNKTILDLDTTKSFTGLIKPDNYELLGFDTTTYKFVNINLKLDGNRTISEVLTNKINNNETDINNVSLPMTIYG